MEKVKLLYISKYVPYDTVPHAGGKVHNFYIKYFEKSGLVDQTLITQGYSFEEKSFDLDKYNIKNRTFVMDRTVLQKWIRIVISGWSYINHFDRYCNLMLNYERYHIKKAVREYYRENRGNKAPQVIILQWTQIVLILPFVKKLFPESKIVAIEEDVLFLNFERRCALTTGLLKKYIAEYQYHKLKKMELEVLKQADLVVTNNPKDTRLLVENKILPGHIYTSTVYFTDYSKVVRNKNGNDVLFYGAMNREENNSAALWFIDHVMPELDQNIRFIIAGANPTRQLQSRQSERVIVKGFVKDVGVYFSSCLCMVAPLLLGAGIKVKVLEAMSAGVPVLTNEVGIEGIQAESGIHYFHCNSAEKYNETIELIRNDREKAAEVSRHAREFISENYDIENNANEILKWISNACN